MRPRKATTSRGALRRTLLARLAKQAATGVNRSWKRDDLYELTRYVEGRSRQLEALFSFEAVAAASQSCRHGPWSRESLHEHH